MKYIKYLVLALIVGIFASSCSQDQPEYPWEGADTSKAFVQIYYMSLVQNKSANNIKYVTINGKEYTYNHQSMIAPYNFAPSMVAGSAYATEPGKCTVKLETESGNEEKGYQRTTVYEGTTEVDLKPGVVSQVIVWDNNGSAPHVHEFGTPPIYHEVDSTGNARFASARLYNYMFDEEGKPTEAKIFFDVRRKSNGEIVASYPEGGLAFGESTDYFTTEVYQDQALDATGYIYVRHDIRAVWPDGREEILLKNDYWSTYMGRSYHYFWYGCYNGDIQSKKLKRFGAK